jgi:flagellar basal body-associated protein FliL
MVQDNISAAEIIDENNPGGTGEGKKKGGKKLVLLIVVLVVVLAALGIGGFYVTQIMEPSVPDYEPIEVVYNFSPGVTTNVSGYEDIYLRFQYSLVFEVNTDTKVEEYNAKIAYIEENQHLVKSATISAVRNMTRNELIDPDAPLVLCDTILTNVNDMMASIVPEGLEYGVREGIGSYIGKDTKDTIAKRAKYEMLSAPVELQFTQCYYTDFIIQ